jgi:uncharacterized membrane-anchored protein
MSHFVRARDLTRYYNPVRAFQRSHRGQPNPISTVTMQDPWGIPIMAYLAFTGIATLLAPVNAVPPSMNTTLGILLVVNWAVSLGFGALGALLGRYYKAYRVEAAGLGFMLYACALYISVVIYVAGFAATVAAAAYVAIGTGAILRLRVLRKAREAHDVAGEIHRANQNNGDAPT